MRIATSTNVCEFVLRKTDKPYYSCEDSIRRVAAAGFQAIDMCFYSFCRPGEPMAKPGWESWVSRHKAIADECGLTVSQAHALIYSADNAEEWEQNEEMMRRCIVAAGQMACPWIVIHPYTRRDEAWFSRRNSFTFSRECFLRYGETAAKHGVGIAVENMIENRAGRRTFCSCAEELVEFVDSFADRRFGVCWDTGHANLNGIDQPGALRMIGDRLKTLHINDNKGERDEHNAPYLGTVNWADFMSVLKEIGYAGDFTYEAQGYSNAFPPEFHDQALRFLFDTARHLLRL